MKFILLNIYFWPVFILATAFAIASAPLIALLNILFYRLPLDELIRRGVRVYGWVVVRVIPFMAPVTIVDKTGGYPAPAIFVPNHSSSLDPYLFGMLPQENAFITTWPFKIPIFKWFMTKAQYIDATNGWAGVQEQAEALFKKGCSLIIWPEGHRSRDGKMRRFKTGAFRLACKTGLPLVPVCIIGSEKVLPPGRRLLTPGRIKVVLLPPIMMDGDENDSEYIKTISNQARQVIAQELMAHGKNQAIIHNAGRVNISPVSGPEAVN